jgi:hypothetical protein
MEGFAPPVVSREADSGRSFGFAVGKGCELLSSLVLPSSGCVETYLTKFCSFSSFVKAATRAAARWAGERLLSHTLFLAKSPLRQSGYV